MRDLVEGVPDTVRASINRRLLLMVTIVLVLAVCGA
jgi:hypothetical protein